MNKTSEIKLPRMATPADQFLYNELELGISGSANLTRNQQKAIISLMRLGAEVSNQLKDNRTDEQKAIGAYYDRAMNRSDNGALDYLSEEREEQ